MFPRMLSLVEAAGGFAGLVDVEPSRTVGCGRCCWTRVCEVEIVRRGWIWGEREKDVAFLCSFGGCVVLRAWGWPLFCDHGRWIWCRHRSVGGFRRPTKQGRGLNTGQHEEANGGSAFAKTGACLIYSGTHECLWKGVSGEEGELPDDTRGRLAVDTLRKLC